MSIIRAIKHRLGLSVTPANNFVLDASADNGTMKLARESGQDIMTVDAAGKPRFNQLAQLLSGNGYKVLEGGLIIQWGGANTNGSGDATVTLPIPFPTGIGVVLAVPALANRNNVFNAYAHSKLLSNFQIYSFQTINGAAQAMAVDWIAIGF